VSELNFRGKNVLVTGGTGMIGRQLVSLLLDEGANVRIASIDDASLVVKGAEFVYADLTDFHNCLEVCKAMDIVFHLAGIKGSPKMTKERPASFFCADYVDGEKPLVVWGDGTQIRDFIHARDVQGHLFLQ
jgi:nucleoside-diphosphate-sugar epimerase